MKLGVEFERVLHPQIASKCTALYADGHYPQAAFEAMKQVELELKERTLAPRHVFGKRLVKRAFREGRGIYLKVPAGPDYQQDALKMFEGAFGYYRNYGAHDGKEIDSGTSARVLCVASELLFLLAASERSLGHQKGVEGLIETGFFASHEEFAHCLRFFEPGHACPEEVFDGYWEDLAKANISEEQEKLFWELEIVGWNWETIELTAFGRSLLAEYTDRQNSPGS
jgi:uncharacterized protein (TIGR02391 family)